MPIAHLDAGQPSQSTSRDPAPEITVAGRRLRPSPVFDTYWTFAAERQAIYNSRASREPGPWTDDPILRAHRFTNCYRATDRVSQYLISRVIYTGDQEPHEVIFRTLLFKMFNRVSTWELLTDEIGEISWSSFEMGSYKAVLDKAMRRGTRLYSAAYVIPPPQFGAVRKHANHLRLLNHMMDDGVVEKLLSTKSMNAAFDVLRSYPAIGDFLAFQFLIDLNYSEALSFDEMDFVVPGPGARDGLRKCFGPQSAGIEAELIRFMSETQAEQFARLGLTFSGLSGRPLQLIDCQNLFCEVDKYSRVAHPEIVGASGRSRIKQRFSAVPEPVTAWFPPKWGINRGSPSSASGQRALA